MRFLTRSISAAALMAAWQLCVPAASAQVESPSPAPSAPAQSSPTPSAPAQSIPDQKLDAAAAALQHVAGLKQDYEQRLAAAPAVPDKERIVAEANDALEKAVTDQGLSVDEYNTIMEVAQNDPNVRDKILQRLRPTK